MGECSCLWLVYPYDSSTDHTQPVYAEHAWKGEYDRPTITVWFWGVEEPGLLYATRDRHWKYVEIDVDLEDVQ